MPTSTYQVQAITANLRKDMSAKMWEAGLNVVLERFTPSTLLGLQEAYTSRNKAILDRVARARGLWVLGLGRDSSLVYDPRYYRLYSTEVFSVPKSSRLGVSPTRISLMAQFQVISSGEWIGALVGHRMNGVYTADAPLHFYRWRKAKWVAHAALDDRLLRYRSLVTIDNRNHHVPIVAMGDMNAHLPLYRGNPFGDHSVLLKHHVSDYLAITSHDLTPNHTVKVNGTDAFHDFSDHLALSADLTITHHQHPRPQGTPFVS